MTCVQNGTNFVFGEQWEWSLGLKEVVYRRCGRTCNHRGRWTRVKSKGTKQVTHCLETLLCGTVKRLEPAGKGGQLRNVCDRQAAEDGIPISFNSMGTERTGIFWGCSVRLCSW